MSLLYVCGLRFQAAVQEGCAFARHDLFSVRLLGAVPLPDLFGPALFRSLPMLRRHCCGIDELLRNAAGRLEQAMMAVGGLYWTEGNGYSAQQSTADGDGSTNWAPIALCAIASLQPQVEMTSHSPAWSGIYVGRELAAWRQFSKRITGSTYLKQQSQ